MITSLRLQHYRSYQDEVFTFSPGVNIIVGPNGSGKTNLLEALLVVCQGSSYRAKDAELLAFSAPWARLDAELANGTKRTLKLIVDTVIKKSYDINGKQLQRLSLTHQLPIVLFEPNHLRLLSGSPELRRTYLDDLLAQTVPGFQTVRLQYRRTLTQRNALLKRGTADISTQLFPWNIRLSQLAAKIVRERERLTRQLTNQIPDLYRSLSTTTTQVTLTYQSQFVAEQYESHLLHKLEASQSLDLARGFTGSGPHRDDLLIYFDGHLAGETASRGETRTAILALKVMELGIIEATRDVRPLLLLDDVFSELDTSRRTALTTYLESYQTIITTTDADSISSNILVNSIELQA
jgi:DNA replication and repair protein RecF